MCINLYFTLVCEWRVDARPGNKDKKDFGACFVPILYMVLNANVSEVAEYEPFSMGKEKLDIDSSDHLYMTCTGM